MENATDALKMAFAVFVFVIALSTVFSLMTKTKEVADTVLWYSDKTNYYDWTDEKTDEGRIVGEDTVISALQTQVKEKVFVQIQDQNGVIEKTFKPSSQENVEQEREDYIKNKLKNGTNKGVFENVKRIDENENEYWLARELSKTLEYKDW